MTTLTFRGYGPGAPEVYVVAERITHWHQIDYNGRYGTRIVLDTGKELNVEEWPLDVESKIKRAIG